MSLSKLYSMQLEYRGFQVINTAKNGMEAIEMYKSFLKKSDIILMDHRMPIKNGIEATKEILMINSKAKIIIASADFILFNQTKLTIEYKKIFLKNPIR